jgi:hypothetical protein
MKVEETPFQMADVPDKYVPRFVYAVEIPLRKMKAHALSRAMTAAPGIKIL